MCAAKGRSPWECLFPAPSLAEDTSPILGLLNLTQSQGDPDKTYRNLPFIDSLSFYPSSCVIPPPCMVILLLDLCFRLPFHPCRKHQELLFIKHWARTGHPASSTGNCIKKGRGKKSAFLSLHFYLCIYLTVSAEEKIVSTQQLPQLWTAVNYRHSHGFT